MSRKQGRSAPDRLSLAGCIQPGPASRGLQFKWADAVSKREWAVYSKAMEVIRGAGVRFLLGGGFALAAYTGRWRDTKDIDFYIHPDQRDKVVAALWQAGFKDYYQVLPYDRNWIFRSIRAGVIVDIIWSMANRRAQVDEAWFERAADLELRGQHLRVVPAEEFMWCKLYILQRDHCDWTDVFNLLYAAGHALDWSHLLRRVGEDVALLRAVLSVYGWLCPRYVRKLPNALWRRLAMRLPQPPRGRPQRNHIRLLDSRGWFAALQPAGRKMEI